MTSLIDKTLMYLMDYKDIVYDGTSVFIMVGGSPRMFSIGPSFSITTAFAINFIYHAPFVLHVANSDHISLTLDTSCHHSIYRFPDHHVLLPHKLCKYQWKADGMVPR